MSRMPTKMCPSCGRLNPGAVCWNCSYVNPQEATRLAERKIDDILTPSDDGEPITREWVAEHFGDKYGRIEIGPHRLFVRSTPGEVDIHLHDEPLSRRQFRRLIAALGWRRRGDHES